MMLQLIMNAGKSGAEQAALDAARDCTLPCTTIAPHDSEKLALPYEKKRELHIRHSDGTIFFIHLPLSERTRRPIELCKIHGRPHTILPVGRVNLRFAVNEIRTLILKHKIEHLHVSGAQQSESPETYPFVYSVMGEVIDKNLVDSMQGSRPFLF
ncbi:YpsA SLOG family protein [Chitinivibrio alkaliphilus]|uniref:Molybdenum cofactor carrier n=1 Tax=Chitinivibrio alkaliphilus ACht1 TaxID=1313304 RepID=U7D5D8_9BACT|nr:putative molybdenum carrier protein [Chitinivibrio alkaliphilus]ERP31163.1 hypothetical protein CALK_1962 [Chitinivibrio alkaliphilus ACht1]